MAKKETSKRLAKIAGKYLNIDPDDFPDFNHSRRTLLRDIKSLAASVLSQYETEQKKK